MPHRRSAPSRKTSPAIGAVVVAAHRRAMEALEARQLLSGNVASPQLTVLPADTASPEAHGGGFNGYTPAQIRHAYGFDQLNLTGAGQTIAIVDAFDDPTIVSDLHVFDTKYGLPDPVLSKINENGRRVRGVPSDRGWSSEIALDVEWAHAIAPGANILVVETNSDSTDDLLAGVNTARSFPGVSVVSLSWGSDEYRTESVDDANFVTPAGHQGVTFIAAAGDEGRAPAEWPATSPYVISVGGTTLKLTSNGDYGSETVWADTTGGTSRFEPEPSWQSAIAGTSTRSTPDVSYDADPNTGFAVYDSYGSGGWTVVAGTSAGVPQWAALVALADQERVANGAATLDGATATLPALYSLYGSSPTSSTYKGSFNDVTSGSNGSSGDGGAATGGGWGRRWDSTADGNDVDAPTTTPAAVTPAAATTPATPPANTCTPPTAAATPAATSSATPAASKSSKANPKSATTATVGYDEESGLGTPKAPAIVNALAQYVVPSTSSRRRRARAAAAKPTAKPSVARRGSPADVSINSQGSADTGTLPPPPAPLAVNPTPPAHVAMADPSSPSGLDQLLAYVQASTVAMSTVPVVALHAAAGGHDSAGSASYTGGSSSDAAEGSSAEDGDRAASPAGVSAPLVAAVVPLAVAPAAIGRAVEQPAAVASATIHAAAAGLVRISPLDAASAFGDAVALFAHESTQVLLGGNGVTLASASPSTTDDAAVRVGSLRAWAVTLGVLATDTVLVGRWVRDRRRRRLASQALGTLELAGVPSGAFSLARVEDEADEDGAEGYVL